MNRKYKDAVKKVRCFLGSVYTDKTGPYDFMWNDIMNSVSLLAEMEQEIIVSYQRLRDEYTLGHRICLFPRRPLNGQALKS